MLWARGNLGDILTDCLRRAIASQKWPRGNMELVSAARHLDVCPATVLFLTTFDGSIFHIFLLPLASNCKNQKSLGIHKIFVRKIWFCPPPQRAQNEERMYKSVGNPRNWHVFGRGWGTQFYGQNDSTTSGKKRGHQCCNNGIGPQCCIAMGIRLSLPSCCYILQQKYSDHSCFNCKGDSFRNARLFIILFVRNFWRVCSQFWLSVRNSV